MKVILTSWFTSARPALEHPRLSAQVTSALPKMAPAWAANLRWGRWLDGERRLDLSGRGRDRKVVSESRGSFVEPLGNVER